MEAEANRATALEFLSLMASFDFDRMFALMADDGVWRVVGDPETFPPGGTLPKSERKAMFDGFISVLASLEFDIASTTAEGDRVAVEFTCCGVSHAGPVYENEFISLFTFRDGKIVSVYEHCGQLAMLAFGQALERQQEG